MCKHCQKGMVAIYEPILDALIQSSDLKPEDLKELVTKAVEEDKLTFKPDKNMGEGTPTEDELNYRQTLIDNLKDVFIYPTTDLDEIDKISTNLIKNSQSLPLS